MKISRTAQVCAMSILPMSVHYCAVSQAEMFTSCVESLVKTLNFGPVVGALLLRIATHRLQGDHSHRRKRNEIIVWQLLTSVI